MLHIIKPIIIFLFVVFASTIKLFSEAENVTAFNYKNLSSTFAIRVGYPFATQSNNFFHEYQDTFLRGKANAFKYSPLLGLSLKFKISEGYRFGITGEYITATMDDLVSDSTLYGVWYQRKNGEKVTINSIPMMLFFEVIPFETQFRTFAGIGAGITYSTIKWEETVKSEKSDDIRTGGTLIDETSVYPTFRLYSGLELGFDKKIEEAFLGSLIIEAGYTMILRYTKAFDNVSKQFINPPPQMNDSYTIFPGYIGLNVELTFNLKTI